MPSFPPSVPEQPLVDRSRIGQRGLGARRLLSSEPLVIGALMVCGLLLCGGGVVWAVRSLLQSPLPSDCRSLPGQSPSPSTLLYCADTIAAAATPASLQQAIQQANRIPAHAPLRQDGERRIAAWSQEILRLGEVAFQSGDLEGAIAIVNCIPPAVATHPLAKKQIQQWQATWATAEAIETETLAKLEQDTWSFLLSARRLLTVDNRYWQTTRYQALLDQSQIAQQIQKRGGKPRPASLPQSGEDLLARWQQQRQQAAATGLEKARQLARTEDLASLKAAVLEAELIYLDHPQQPEVQQLIQTWNRQIEQLEDLPRLKRAISLARKGDSASLQRAIDEASQILYGRALYDPAQQQIERWTQQLMAVRVENQMVELQRIGDRPSPSPVSPTVHP